MGELRDVISNRVTEIYIHVSNYEQSLDWYSNVLGIEKDNENGLVMQDVRIRLIESEKKNPITHAVFSLVSTDIYKAHEVLKARGAIVDNIYYCPYELTTSFHVTDCNNYPILIKDC